MQKISTTFGDAYWVGKRNENLFLVSSREIRWKRRPNGENLFVIYAPSAFAMNATVISVKEPHLMTEIISEILFSTLNLFLNEALKKLN